MKGHRRSLLTPSGTTAPVRRLKRTSRRYTASDRRSRSDVGWRGSSVAAASFSQPAESGAWANW